MTSINRLPVFLALIAVLLRGAAVTDNGRPQGLREAYTHMGKVVFTPFLTGVSESIGYGPLCMPALVMKRIENRKFSNYRLLLHLWLKKFGTGCLAGFPVIRGIQPCDGPAAFCYRHEL